MSMVLSAKIVSSYFVTSYTPIDEIISLKRKKLSLPGGCLFGPPDPEDTAQLIREQLQYDRERMLRKYDFDIVEHSIPNHARKINLKKVSTSNNNNNNNGEVTSDEDILASDDENVLSRIRGEDSSTSIAEDDDSTRTQSAKIFKFTDSKLHKVQHRPVFKKQSHLTDFWRSKRRMWEASTKAKLRSESSTSWKKSIQHQ